MPKKTKKELEVVEPNSEFELTTPTNEEISADDFKLVTDNKVIHDQKLETKPTTFLKDAFRRFRKNKSSVVAAWILGIIILLAIFVPVFDTSDVSTSHPEMTYLEPKLFDAGTGWWDGCKTVTDVTMDPASGLPADYKPEAVRGTFNEKSELINVTNNYGIGGYVNILKDNKINNEISFYSQSFDKTYSFSTATNNSIEINLLDEEYLDFVRPTYSIDLKFMAKGGMDFTTLRLVDNCTEYNKLTINVTEKIKDVYPSVENIGYYSLIFTLDVSDQTVNKNLFIKNILPTTDSNDAEFITNWKKLGFEDANRMLLLPKENEGYWTCLNGTRGAYKVEILKCDFVFDTYEDKLGDYDKMIGKSDMDAYIAKGYCTFNYDDPNSLVILSDKCPVLKVYKVNIIKGKVTTINLDVRMCRYKELGYSSMPKFLFGTDKTGRDMFKYVFEGLRTSLIMGIITAAVCFTFGLLWGSISGYFGGNVDLAMERFTDILSGMPWIVIMTLCIVHLGQSFGVFVLALCLTGWIGTSATTRTQFYRFKGREYVLASRTLGASDFRLIFKHILPNAMGTIITGAVLMVPSVIFSEATISYLGLGLKGLSSLGVILSDNQAEIHDHAFLLIFPSVVIALLMICFNLFGNGLRDAINPSLKGEGE